MVAREKTDVVSRIPLLPPALELIERYRREGEEDAPLLPVSSNQKMNAYLKEIADVCGISKNLTFHLARHTFATTITLSNGVPIETVGRMLGHRSLKTTRHYARILDGKIGADMQALKQKLERKADVSRPDLRRRPLLKVRARSGGMCTRMVHSLYLHKKSAVETADVNDCLLYEKMSFCCKITGCAVRPVSIVGGAIPFSTC